MNIDLVHSSLAQSIFALVASLIAAVFAFWTAGTLRIEKSSARRLEKFSGTKPAGMVEEVGMQVMRTTRMQPESWAVNLDWAKLGGHFPDWTMETMVGRAVIFGLATGFALIFLGTSFLLVLGGAALGAFFIVLQVNSRAGEVKTQVIREVPSAAALIAAELAAGNPPDTAIERAAMVAGPMGALLQRGLNESRTSGRPLFSHKPVRGTLSEILMGAGITQLTAFSAQLDMVAAKGVQGADLMTTIAKSIAREHQSVLQERAEALENMLLAPMVIFFFLPFIVAIMLPMILGMFTAF